MPCHDDRSLFEMLILEGAQAGLSWSTILAKRENYRRAFASFDPREIARFAAKDVRGLLADPGIVRNRAKIEAVVANAQAFLAVQREFGTFDRYLWAFVDGRPILNAPRSLKDLPAETALSRALSKDLVKRGFRFVGPKICYAFMQSVGLVNDHIIGCFRRDRMRGQVPTKPPHAWRLCANLTQRLCQPTMKIYRIANLAVLSFVLSIALTAAARAEDKTVPGFHCVPRCEHHQNNDHRT